MAAVADEMKSAQEEILIADWQLVPHNYILVY